jgi:hypothetical protein
MAAKHEESMVRAPEGFRRLGSVANAGWFNMKKIGNVLQGSLEGMFERKDDLRPEKKSNFFQIKITRPCEVRIGTAEAARLVEAKVGDSVNVNYGPRTKLLEPLIPLLAQGAEFDVWGTVLSEKIKLSGGRSMHNFDLFTKPTKAPMASEDSEPDFDDAADEAAAG